MNLAQGFTGNLDKTIFTSQGFLSIIHPALCDTSSDTETAYQSLKLGRSSPTDHDCYRP
jgi:hypothetical protein